MDDYVMTTPMFVFASGADRDRVLTEPSDGEHSYLMDTGTFWVWCGGWQLVEG